MQRSAGQVESAQHGSFITAWSESMKLFNDLISTDYGLMSLAVIVITLGMSVFFARYFSRKMRESEAEQRKG